MARRTESDALAVPISDLALVPWPARLHHTGAPGAPLSAPVETEFDPDLGPECYTLDTTGSAPQIVAGDARAAGHARATLRQLALGASRYPGVRIWDRPRYPYRGLMLDLARRFHPVATVLEVLAVMAELKLNVLHLHLTDDQGWRLEIDGWPALTEIGASGGTNGLGAGFLTRADYRRIVSRAAELGIDVVPEIDVPGHVNAALVAYPELAVAGYRPVPYEGTEVGFSQLDVRGEAAYRLVQDAVAQLVQDTPGRYLHLGGDECLSMPQEDYLYFLERALPIVTAAGRTPMVWHEAGRSRCLPPGTVGQYWNLRQPRGPREDRFGIDHAARARSFVEQGGALVLSPADVAYLDHPHAAGQTPGQIWAEGPTPLRDAYDWDPAAVLPGVGPAGVLGVEATCFTETIGTREELWGQLLPRLAAVAEVAWSPPGPRRIADLAGRLAGLGRDWRARGIPFHPAPEVTW